MINDVRRIRVICIFAWVFVGIGDQVPKIINTLPLKLEDNQILKLN